MTGANPDAKVWLARTGEAGYALTDCVERGVVALRYRTVGDARTMTVDEIAARVGEAGTRTALVAVAGMLHEFIHGVQLRDIVVTPHAASRTIYVGEVVGEYEWADPAPVADLLHFRAVRWVGSLDRDTDLTADRCKEIDRPPTFYRLSADRWWLERVDILTANDEPVVAPPRAPRPNDGGSGGASIRRPEIPTITCTTCFLQKPAALLVDGICIDCR